MVAPMATSAPNHLEELGLPLPATEPRSVPRGILDRLSHWVLRPRDEAHRTIAPKGQTHVKFGSCVPDSLLEQMLAARDADLAGGKHALGERILLANHG